MATARDKSSAKGAQKNTRKKSAAHSMVPRWDRRPAFVIRDKSDPTGN